MTDLQRQLTLGEQREAHSIYGARIRYAEVRIIRGKAYFFQPDDTAMAPDGNVYFPTPIYRPDYSVGPDPMSFLIHELAHVWQIHSGVWLKTRRVFRDGGDYNYELDASRTLQSYKVEEQAALIADYYRIRRGLAPQRGRGPLADYATIVNRAMGR